MKGSSKEKERNEYSINELVRIKLGKYEQSILIRGKKQNNPLLLFLHGGPGIANIGVAAWLQQSWEEHFVVVNWDQLGAGLSYSKGIEQADMSIEKMIEYMQELVCYLQKRFHKKKIHIVGHSWGSILGIKYAYYFPQNVEKYVSVSQVVNGEENEKKAYDFVWDVAESRKDRKVMKRLSRIGKAPYKDWLQGLQVRSAAGTKYGAMMRNGTPASIYLKGMIRSKEYNLRDIYKWMKGTTFSIKCIWPEVMKMDLTQEIECLQIPVLFCLGRYDYQAPACIAESFIKNIYAEQKEVIWFENSAHMSLIEEKEKFDFLMLQFLKRTTDEESIQ